MRVVLGGENAAIAMRDIRKNSLNDKMTWFGMATQKHVVSPVRHLRTYVYVRNGKVRYQSPPAKIR